MKMISSTSMMSTSGVTLMSVMMPRRRTLEPAITAPLARRRLAFLGGGDTVGGAGQAGARDRRLHRPRARKLAERADRAAVAQRRQRRVEHVSGAPLAPEEPQALEHHRDRRDAEAQQQIE